MCPPGRLDERSNTEGRVAEATAVLFDLGRTLARNGTEATSVAPLTVPPLRIQQVRSNKPYFLQLHVRARSKRFELLPPRLVEVRVASKLLNSLMRKSPSPAGKGQSEHEFPRPSQGPLWVISGRSIRTANSSKALRFGRGRSSLPGDFEWVDV